VSRVSLNRDATSHKALAKRDDQALHRLLQQTLVFGLARLKPCPLVMFGEVCQELDGIG
jgi:hypothetical protein